MPFKPPPVQPDFSSLVTSLDNSKTQKSNYSLYQTILFLIQNTQKARDLLVKDVNTIDELIDKVLAATFVTTSDETVLFLNSKQITPGPGISFHVSGNRLVISASVPWPENGEANESIPIAPQSMISAAGATGPMGPPGFDAESQESNDSMPFVGNSILNGATGGFTQVI